MHIICTGCNLVNEICNKFANSFFSFIPALITLSYDNGLSRIDVYPILGKDLFPKGRRKWFFKMKYLTAFTAPGVHMLVAMFML